MSFWCLFLPEKRTGDTSEGSEEQSRQRIRRGGGGRNEGERLTQLIATFSHREREQDCLPDRVRELAPGASETVAEERVEERKGRACFGDDVLNVGEQGAVWDMYRRRMIVEIAFL